MAIVSTKNPITVVRVFAKRKFNSKKSFRTHTKKKVIKLAIIGFIR